MYYDVKTVCVERHKKTNINENIYRYFIKKNRTILEQAFFNEECLSTWSIKYYTNFISEIIFIKCLGDHYMDRQKIDRIYQDSISSFVIPDYVDYINYCEEQLNQTSLAHIVVQQLTNTYGHGYNDITEFNRQIKLIIDTLNDPFHENIVKISNVKIMNDKYKFSDALIDAGDTLKFMGCYIILNEGETLKHLLVGKILEKYYGTNEQNSVYHKYRNVGKIYFACTGFILEKSLFYTGVISEFSEELYTDILDSVRNVSLEKERLEDSKVRVIHDLNYVRFQFGEEFCMLPYKLYIGEKISFNCLLDNLMQITLNDIKELLEQPIVLE